jgi:putative addiction module killer protein
MQSPKQIKVVRSQKFNNWLVHLRDDRAQVAIERRLRRLENGNFGDAHGVGGSVSELRIDYGPGYRLYFVRVRNVIVVLLCGGTKATQRQDIVLAQTMALRAEEIANGPQG